MTDACIMRVPSEVIIGFPDGIVQPWDMAIGNPRDHPPVVLFTGSDVHLALRQKQVTLPNRETLTVTRYGFATVTTQNGAQFVYELFPARFSDDKPYYPICYVGRWPD